MQRRNFFKGAATAVAAASVSRVAMAALPEPASQSSADTAAPLVPPNGRPYRPVVTLNGWTTPWRMNQGVKGGSYLERMGSPVQASCAARKAACNCSRCYSLIIQLSFC